MSEKTALVWGASGGIGAAIVNKLTAEEWPVVAVCRDETKLATTADLVVEMRDIGDEFSLQSAVMEIGREVDEIDLFVYAVGDITAAPVAEMDADTHRRILDANLTGAYLATHHSLPLLAEDAHLFYLGALHEKLRLPGLSAYAAAKAGLEAFAESLKKEQRKKTITVIRPGAVETALWDKVPMNVPKEAMTPQKVAEKLWEAYADGHKGTLDLTH